MSPEEKQQLDDMTAGLATLTTNVAALAASVSNLPHVQAANLLPKVEPHASKLEACADAMEAAGIGSDPNNGHAVHLRKMAGSMRADAAQGRMPSAFGHMWGSAAVAPAPVAPAVTVDLAAQVTELLKPVTDQLAAMGTKFEDLKAKAFREVPAPARKTLAPEISGLLAKAGIESPADGSKLSLDKLNAAMKELPVETRLKVKAGLTQAGLLD